MDREQKNTPSQHQKEGVKVKNDSVNIPSISLPTSGGAIRAIDEKFSVNAVNGTAAFYLPFPISQGRGFAPTLGINYNSANGNCIFGLGWSLSISSIKRKTGQKLPEYLDGNDSDVFVFSGAEDLVPALKKDAVGKFLKDPDG